MSDPVDVDVVSGLVEQCPSVVRLASSGDRPGSVEVATYLPGRRVPGVRVVEGAVEVHVVARYGRPLPEVATEIRRALAPAVDGLAVAVFIDDLELAG